MVEADVAASWRPEIVGNPFRVRVVTTGMVIAYARVFTRTGDYTLDREEYAPTDPAQADLHESFIRWRDSDLEGPVGEA
jgi:hypothetical protein